jgi:hypothetical protein
MSRLYHSGDPEYEPPRELNVFDSGYLYGAGKTLEIFSHQPPQPFGQRGLIPPFDKNPRIMSQEDLKSRSPSDHVFTKLPLERQPDSRMPEGLGKYIAQEDKATLVVTRVLDMEDGIGAQVVLCKFKKYQGEMLKPIAYWDQMGLNDRPNEVVAKIYDPLLYRKTSIIKSYVSPDVRPDIVNAADREYAREAAAYAELHDAAKTQPIVNDFVPRFYGTWTTIIKNEGWGRSDTRPSDDAANGIHHERPVRIILMEYIKGETIWAACRRRHHGFPFPVLVPDEQKGYNLEFRLNILARILRGLVTLQHIGVLPLEVWATNFMIANGNDQPPDNRLQALGKTRVVLINYGRLQVTRYATSGPHPDQSLPRPRHPVLSKYTLDELTCLAGWYPLEWRKNNQPFIEWVLKVFRREDFAEWTEAEVKKATTRVPIPPPAPFEPFKETKAPRESAKQLSESEKAAPSAQNIREAILSDQESASAADADSVFDNDYTDQERESSKSTVNRRRSSSQSNRPSGLSSAWTADEATAKEAGKKATESGITTVEEVEGGEAEEGDLADNEVSPKSSSGEERGRERERKRKGE